MPVKKYDAAVVVGEYKKGDETKKRYLNVGSVMEGDNGGLYLLLDRTFNPAGVPNPDGRGNVAISFFEPKQSGGSNSGGGGQQAKPAQGAGSPDNFDDDIPF